MISIQLHWNLFTTLTRCFFIFRNVKSFAWPLSSTLMLSILKLIFLLALCSRLWRRTLSKTLFSRSYFAVYLSSGLNFSALSRNEFKDGSVLLRTWFEVVSESFETSVFRSSTYWHESDLARNLVSQLAGPILVIILSNWSFSLNFILSSSPFSI